MFIALRTSSDSSKFVAIHLPLLKDESKTNLMLIDLSPSTVIDFFLKDSIWFFIKTDLFT